MEAADASFSTDTLSMSSGFRMLMLPLGTPSITTNGLALPHVLIPLILNDVELCPGVADELTTVKPGASPCNPDPTVVIGRPSNSDEDIVLTAPVRFTFFWVP